jgi:hypothetical protein
LIARSCALLALVPSHASAQTKSATYEPSPARVEAGPILFVGAYDLWGFGGTVSVHYAIGARRLFFLGGRLAFLGGTQDAYGGAGGFADAEVGVRPRLATGRTGAFALVFAGGVGGALIGSSALSAPFPHPVEGFFHLAMRVGPSFDVGAFALDAVAGPAMLASNFGAAGAFECALDLGVRF